MRKPVISRTFNGLQATAMLVDTETAEVMNRTVLLPRIPPEKKLEEAVKAALDLKETERFVQVVDTLPFRRRFAMSEEDFMSIAEEVDLLKAYGPAGVEAEENEEDEESEDVENGSQETV